MNVFFEGRSKRHFNATNFAESDSPGSLTMGALSSSLGSQLLAGAFPPAPLRAVCFVRAS